MRIYLLLCQACQDSKLEWFSRIKEIPMNKREPLKKLEISRKRCNKGSKWSIVKVRETRNRRNRKYLIPKWKIKQMRILEILRQDISRVTDYLRCIRSPKLERHINRIKNEHRMDNVTELESIPTSLNNKKVWWKI